MKVTIELDLEIEQDKDFYENTYSYAYENRRAVEDIKEFIRSKLKYAEINKESQGILEEIREILKKN